jgi:hypothetical protein
LDYVTRHVNEQTSQNLPIYRQNYIIYIIERRELSARASLVGCAAAVGLRVRSNPQLTFLRRRE